MKKRNLLILLLSMVMVLLPAFSVFADTEEAGNTGDEVVVDVAEDEDLPAAVEEPAPEEPVAEEPAAVEEPAVRSAFTGWDQDEESGLWYYYKDGEMVYGWKYIGNYWFYFDEEEGYMWAEDWLEYNGDTYYFDNSGHMKTGWLKETWTDEEEGETHTTWYYFFSSGKQAFGWQKIGGYWYYFDEEYEEGYMYADQWLEYNGNTYYFDNSGKMKTGWLKQTWTDEEEGETYTDWCYFKSSGAQAFGWQKISGKWYYLDEDSGFMYYNDWLHYKNKWYFFDKSGAMKTGWLKQVYDDGYTVWYYFNSSGVQLMGWQKISSKWYFFPEYWDGEMATGPCYDDNAKKTYLFASNGVWRSGFTGWYDDDGDWWYFKKGVGVNGWQKISNKWYFFEDGWMYANAWAQDSKGWYWMDEDGHYVTNTTIEIEGEEYTFGSDGICENPPF